MESIINNTGLDSFLDKVAEACAEEMKLSVEDFKEKYEVIITRDFVTGTTMLKTNEVHRMRAKVSADDLRSVIEALAKVLKEE